MHATDHLPIYKGVGQLGRNWAYGCARALWQLIDNPTIHPATRAPENRLHRVQPPLGQAPNLHTERGAIDFLGLAWQDELLDYQTTAKARGRIHTPSYSQVVQPLYKSASDRWRAYEHHLMQESIRVSNWITAYGYDT